MPHRAAAPAAPIDAVAFDVGNVLVEWNPRLLYRTLFDDPAAMEWFLANVCTESWNAALDAGQPFAEGVAELSRAWPAYAELIACYDTRWTEMLGRPHADTVALMLGLQRGGYGVYGLTNFATEKFAIARQLHPFLDAFAGVVVSGDEGCVKPDPRIYRLLCERYGLAPARTVFVDDRPANVETAIAEGFIGLVYHGPSQLRADLAALGVTPPP